MGYCDERSTAPRSTEAGANVWLAHTRANPEARLRLYCFPYSGADASVFARWAESLPAAIEICPVQLPGRGKRIAEPLVTDVNKLVDRLTSGLLAHMLEKPYALFGHSLGGLVAFELARRLRDRFSHEPVHMFVSACDAPQIVAARNPRMHELPEAEFMGRLQGLNRDVAALFADAELKTLFLPILRADFKMFETYEYRQGVPLRCAVTAIGGFQDEHVRVAELDAWREHTLGPFAVRMVPGDHLFVNTSRPYVLKLIAGVLCGSAAVPTFIKEPELKGEPHERVGR